MSEERIITSASVDDNALEITSKKERDFRALLWTYLFPVMLFLVITVQSRFMAAIMPVILLAFIIGRKPFGCLKDRLTMLTVAVILYAAMALASGLYSDFGAYAAKESAKTVSAVALFVLVLAMMGKKHISYILTSLASVCAVVSLLCIDAASLTLLTKAYSFLTNLFMYDSTGAFTGYEQGIRITGIFGNPNVSAGIVAFGVLVSYYLVNYAKKEKHKAAYSIILGINAIGFLLSFSMGAIVAFSLACIIFLVAEGKGRRVPLLLLMLVSVFSSILISFAIYPFLGKVSVFPLIFALLNGALIYIFERFVVVRLSALLQGKAKLASAIVGALVVLAAVYAVLGLNITGGIEINAGQNLSRAEYLNSGNYSLDVEAEGSTKVLVYSQNKAELMMHKNTVLFDGDANTAEFVVPEDSRVTWFVFSTPDKAQLKTALLSDGTSLKLGYMILPEFAANRLQGLFANQNFIQRLVFFEDGIKLFKESPIIGFGLGSVEGKLTSVQDFYYESVYIHNHFIQIMDEMGVVGLLLFVILLVTAVVTLLKNRKTSNPLLALLISCVAMMIFHSITEVVWSTGMYQTVCYLIFAVIIIEYSKPLKLASRKFAGAIPAASMCLLVVCFGSLVGGNVLASKMVVGYKPADRNELLSTMVKLDRMDCYDDSFYKSTYMMNAVGSENLEESNRAGVYAKQLRETGEYRACTDVAMYYYLPKQLMIPMFEASREALAQEASNPNSWNLQLDFYQQAVSYISSDKTQEFVDGVMKTLEYYDEFNSGRMDQIVLTDKNKVFVECVKTLAASKTTQQEAYAVLSSICAQQQ